MHSGGASGATRELAIVGLCKQMLWLLLLLRFAFGDGSAAAFPCVSTHINTRQELLDTAAGGQRFLQ